MKATFNREHLFRVCHDLLKFTNNKFSGTAFYVIRLIIGRDGFCKISATNGRAGMEVKDVQASNIIADENRIAFIPADILTRTLQGIPDQDIDLEITATDMILYSSNGRYKIGGEAELKYNFPAMPEEMKTAPVEELFSQAQRVVFATSKPDGLRSFASSLYVEPEGNSLNLVCTQGTMLAKLTLPAMEGFDNKMLIEKENVDLLAGALSYSSVYKIGFRDLDFFVSNDYVDFFIRLNDETYPPYKAVIPVYEKPISFLVERLPFLQSLKRFISFANHEYYFQLVMTDQSMKIYTRDTVIDKSSEESVSTLEQNGEIKIQLNIQMVMSTLASLTDKTVRFEMTAPNKAVLVKTDEKKDEDFLCLVMPSLITPI